MASGETRQCFTFTWKLENSSYYWKKEIKWIKSPEFVINEDKWALYLIPRYGNRDDYMVLMLGRPPDEKRKNNVEIDYELVYLTVDGAVLKSVKKMKRTFPMTGIFESDTEKRIEQFVINRSAFVPEDTLMIRCRVWECAGEILEHVQCVARTVIGVEKRSFTWNIRNFSSLERGKKYSYHIKSLSTCEQLMTLDLFLTGALNIDGTIRFSLTPNDPQICFSEFHLSLVDASGNKVECIKNEFKFDKVNKSKQFTEYFSETKLLEMEDLYLSNNVLSIKCECALSFGIVLQEIEKIYYESTASESIEPDSASLVRQDVLISPKIDLINNLKSLLNSGCHSDIKLKTSTKTYPAHKCILSTRSPVFSAMFANEMKENIDHCVDITDLNDNTVLRLLQYIYSAEVEELDWDSASELYEAADKYEVLSLKDICSSYLKNNLCQSNACVALVLADQHQDEDLKGFVQNFILKHGKYIISSEDWKKLMETHLKLAAETMCLKFNE